MDETTFHGITKIQIDAIQKRLAESEEEVKRRLKQEFSKKPHNTTKEMNMKVELKEEEKVEREYPWLGESKEGSIVLFVSWGSGVALKHSIHPKGEFLKCWDMKFFTPFNGEVVLSNE
ncbi:MAG: hypothetical protein P1U50_01025 [Parvibaculaceae bacterium]|nr:hypothetical protein [Parvibaculaceae bacterium]